MAYGRDRTIVKATIAVGASLSAEVNVNALRIVGIVVPAGTEGTAITFQAWNPEALDFLNVHDSAGTELSITVAASRYVALADTLPLLGLGRIKVRTGSSGTPTNQAGADANIHLVCVND